MKASPDQPGPATGSAAPCSLVPTNLSNESPLPFRGSEQRFNAWALPPAKELPLAPVTATNHRCRVKGCVFPAAPGDTGMCLQHARQSQEPSLFRSHQPSMLLLDRAKFGLPDSDADNSRSSDRRRMAKLRENFLNGAT
jgi:hypothetical protein